jgi:replicative DNA helicase
MSEPRFQTVADLLDPWRDDVLSGRAPTLYPIGMGELGRLEIGPGLVVLIGGAPGAGKSGLVMQMVVDALMMTPNLKALVCNVEMSPGTLLDRQLARIADIDLTLIRHRRLGAEHAEAVERGMLALEALADRLAFVRPPYDLTNVAASADAFDAALIVLDYCQRIASPGEHGDRRGAIDATMDYLRKFAGAGVAIIVVSSIGRSKDSKGRSTYTDGLSLASYKESGELEYGADDAYMLIPSDDDGSEGGSPSRVVLRHLKSRYGQAKDIELNFDGKHQRFTAAGSSGPAPRTDSGRLQAALRGLWDRTQPAHDGADEP